MSAKFKSKLSKETRKAAKNYGRINANAFVYANAFANLIDACGTIAMAQNVIQREKRYESSFYSNLLESATESADLYLDTMVRYGRRMKINVGRKKDLVNLLVNSKGRRKYYKYYVTKPGDPVNRAYSPSELKVFYDYDHEE